MTILSVVLSFISNIISSVLGEVLKDVLKTPAIETSVEKVEGSVPVNATSTDALVSKYGMLDRG